MSASQPAATISDTVTVGGTPGGARGTSAPATPGRTVTVSALARQEYVAGGVGGSGDWYGNYAKSLPWAVDDITADFGDDLYERMLLDPQVAALIVILKTAILEDGVQLTAAIDDPDDPEAARALDLAERAEAMFGRLETPTDAWLWDMLDAVAFGNRIAEVTYGVVADALDVIAVRPKPRRALAFVVDAYSRVIGLLARIPGQGAALLQGVILDPAQVPNLLPRDKFAICTFRAKDGDPRGTSILRSAYTAWQYKQQVLREHLKYLTQFASPSLIGYTAPEAPAYAPTDSLGNPTGAIDPLTGYPIVISPEQLLQQSLTQFKNGTALALTYGSKVDVLQNAGDGHAFLSAFDLYDRYITKAILGQTLASEEGKHQARAAAQVHQDILDTIIKQAKRLVCRMIERDILAVWVRLNWGDGLGHLVPTVSLGSTEQPDMTAMITALATANRYGLLAPSQMTTVDGKIGLPQRSPEEVQALTDKLLAPPPPPPPPTVPGMAVQDGTPPAQPHDVQGQTGGAQ